jgi:ureidoacrylate peracid hydrolase
MRLRHILLPAVAGVLLACGVPLLAQERTDDLAQIINPRHTVLIVHEMLNDFISDGGAYHKMGRRHDPARIAKVLPPMQKLIAAARAKNVRLVYVRYTTHADGSTTPLANRRPNATPGMVDGTWGWQNIDAVKPEPGDWIIRKYRPDSFYATPLDAMLRWNEIKSVVIMGIGASSGMIPTLIHGSTLGYRMVTVGDCMLAIDPTLQDESMRSIGRLSLVKTHAEILQGWEKVSGSAQVR